MPATLAVAGASYIGCYLGSFIVSYLGSYREVILVVTEKVTASHQGSYLGSNRGGVLGSHLGVTGEVTVATGEVTLAVNEAVSFAFKATLACQLVVTAKATVGVTAECVRRNEARALIIVCLRCCLLQSELLCVFFLCVSCLLGFLLPPF